MKRQAATARGLERRIRDLGLEQVADPRDGGKVKYQLPTLLTALLAAMVTRARSLRGVEERTGQMAEKQGLSMGLTRRIADNTFGKVLPRLTVADLVARLQAMVKAEQRRGNLQPTLLRLGTVAIDGKNVATIHWGDLCRVLGKDPATAQPGEVKQLLAARFPALQFCVPQQGEPYALARAHTVTLISAAAAQCVHERPILGCTNEVGSMADLLEELHAAYGRTSLIKMVTTDAGNTSLKAASQVRGYGWHYFMQIKSEHQDLYAEAERALGQQGAGSPAHSSETDQQNGKLVTYHLWQYDLSDQGWLDWTHARQLVRVQRTTVDPVTGEKSVGNRYYVCSLSTTALARQRCLKISRAHWRCEDETHWTVDAVLQEDRRRLAWSRHPDGVFVVSLLRMMALNIMAVARKLSRVGYSLEPPSWRQVAEHFLLVLCGSILVTDAFDVEN
jgi:Transposase DDE domain